MKCPICDSTKLRTSHLRAMDFPRLLLLRYPVRCLRCRERQYAGIVMAWMLGHGRQEQGKEASLGGQAS